MDLFQADNFSRSTVILEALDEALTTKLQTVLGQYFVNPVILEAEKIVTGINSINYKVRVEHQGEEKTVLLRHCRLLNSLEQIEYSLQVITSLEQRNIPVSSIVLTKDGNTLAHEADGYWVVFNFITGSYFRPTLEAYASLAKTIARLHGGFSLLPEKLVAAAAEFNTRNTATYFNAVPEYAAQDFIDLEFAITTKPEIVEGTVLKSSLPFIVNTIKNIQADLLELRNLPEQIIHSDIHPHNILFQGDEVVAVIDFDAVRPSKRIRDVAAALYRFGRQFMVYHGYKEGEWCLQAAVLREVFLKEYGVYNPLTSAELRLLSSALKDQFLRQILFVGRAVYFKNIPWQKELVKFIMALQEVDYFF